MSLADDLSHVRSEEDVKDAYIKALGLKKHTKGLIDIQTDEIWFEAKSDGKESYHKMFTQLLHYVQVALNAGEALPPLLAVIDTEKAALMKSSTVLPFLAQKTIKWGKNATSYTPQALAAISAHIGTHFVGFKIPKDATEFITTVKAAIATGEIVRAQITPDNLKQAFDKWCTMIGQEVAAVPEEKYALLFFADIMHDGTKATHTDLPAELLFKNGKPVFQLEMRVHELSSTEGYFRFWTMYHRPPPQEHRNYLLERRDSLIPLDERGFKGAFYTPLHVVDKAYDYLQQALGKNWQKNYIVWDMCCGVGNLEVKHSNHRQLFMSTLDQPDVDVMISTKTCVAAHRFQYDYLNDDITDEGSIDYSLTSKVPKALRDAIASGKKLLVLINPPYAEAMKNDNRAGGGDAEAKVAVATTRVASKMDPQGYASRELFTQFLVRIAKEIPTATVAIFSKLKYVNAPNFELFRSKWNAKYLGGFIVHSKAFDGLKGDFPIGFLIWKTSGGKAKAPLVSIQTDVLDRNGMHIGIKSFHNDSSAALMGDWLMRPRPNDQPALPLKNAITPATTTTDVRGRWWADGAIGGMMCGGSDMQHAAIATCLLSSGYGSAGGFLVTKENLWQVAVAFTARLCTQKTWQNDRDQLLAPTSQLSDEFQADCLIWMLFNGQNLSASANGLEWNGQKWSLVNHFIPYTEEEVGSSGRFESDFMVRYLKGKKLSTAAKAVLNAARPVWATYFEAVDPKAVREQFKLNRPDVGWYQVRNALKLRGTLDETLRATLVESYGALTKKLRPQIFDTALLRA